MTLAETNAIALEYRTAEEQRRDEILILLVEQFKGMMCKRTPPMARYRREEKDCFHEFVVQMMIALEKWKPERSSFSTTLYLYLGNGLRNYIEKSSLIKVHNGIKGDKRPQFQYLSLDVRAGILEGSHDTWADIIPA